MKVLSLFAMVPVCLSLAALVGCEIVPPDESASNPVPESSTGTAAVGDAVPNAATLQSWADTLAESELKQLAAAEMLYHARTYEHSLVTDSGFLTKYGKFFRQFTDYEIVDIERTTSLLHPVKYTIQYNFDAVGTVPIDAKRDETAKIARARTDYFFVKEQSDKLVRTYESDAQGRPINPYSPYLDRPNYWQYLTTEDLFGHRWSLRDVTRSDV